MSLLLIHGSPSHPSRSEALADGIAERLKPYYAFVSRVHVRSLPSGLFA